MHILILFLIFVWFIGALCTMEYAIKIAKADDGKVTPIEYVFIFCLSLLSWVSFLGLILGNYFKKRNEKSK